MFTCCCGKVVLQVRNEDGTLRWSKKDTDLYDTPIGGGVVCDETDVYVVTVETSDTIYGPQSYRVTKYSGTDGTETWSVTFDPTDFLTGPAPLNFYFTFDLHTQVMDGSGGPAGLATVNDTVTTDRWIFRLTSGGSFSWKLEDTDQFNRLGPGIPADGDLLAHAAATFVVLNGSSGAEKRRGMSLLNDDVGFPGQSLGIASGNCWWLSGMDGGSLFTQNRRQLLSHIQMTGPGSVGTCTIAWDYDDFSVISDAVEISTLNNPPMSKARAYARSHTTIGLGKLETSTPGGPITQLREYSGGMRSPKTLVPGGYSSIPTTHLWGTADGWGLSTNNYHWIMGTSIRPGSGILGLNVIRMVPTPGFDDLSIPYDQAVGFGWAPRVTGTGYPTAIFQADAGDDFVCIYHTPGEPRHHSLEITGSISGGTS